MHSPLKLALLNGLPSRNNWNYRWLTHTVAFTVLALLCGTHAKQLDIVTALFTNNGEERTFTFFNLFYFLTWFYFLTFQDGIHHFGVILTYNVKWNSMNYCYPFFFKTNYEYACCEFKNFFTWWMLLASSTISVPLQEESLKWEQEVGTLCWQWLMKLYTKEPGMEYCSGLVQPRH